MTTAITAPDQVQLSRRQALLKIVGGSIALALGGWGLGYVLGRQQEAANGAGQPVANLPTPSTEPTVTSGVSPEATLSRGG